MKRTALRAPAYPLINMDPYISIWSMGDYLCDDKPRFWTEKPCTMLGVADIDGQTFRFMGKSDSDEIPAMKQTSVRFDSFSTFYTFSQAGIELTVTFTSPLLPDNFLLMSRPVTYLSVSSRSADGQEHKVDVTIMVSGQICIENTRWRPLITDNVKVDSSLNSIRIGGQEQAVLGKSGDGVGIDWGYFYLSANGDSNVGTCKVDDIPGVYAKISLDTKECPEGLFLLAYDDIHSLIYFNESLDAYWKSDGTTIEQTISDAYHQYSDIMERENLRACVLEKS